MRASWKVLLWVLGCETVGFLGGIFTASSIQSWYQYLNKPFFSPPNWVFGPVWTTLYFLMGVSAYLVWAKGIKKKVIQEALNYFYMQIALNFIWSLIFFGLKSPLLAFVDILVLWGVILITIIKFRKISALASYLLYPYLVWVSFAGILNLAIVVLN